MTTTYTYISKASIMADWSNVNAVSSGKVSYDDMSINYDNPNVYYDGINNSLWKYVPKASFGSLRKVGMATGLIMPPTYSTEEAVNGWTFIPKGT